MGGRARADQRAGNHGQPEKRPEKVRPGRAGQRLPRDHRQEGRRDDVAEACQAVEQHQRACVAAVVRRRRRQRCDYRRRAARRACMRAVVEDAPDHGDEQQRHQPEADPRGVGPPAPGQPAQQARRRDADARAGVDHAAERRRAGLGQAPQAPARGEDEGPGAHDARRGAQHPPGREAVQQTHAQEQQRRGDQAAAHHARRGHADRRARQRTDEVAEVVERGQQAARFQVQLALVEHDGKHGGEGEAPEAHRHGQGHHAGQRGPPAAARLVSGIRHPGVSDFFYSASAAATSWRV